MQTAVRKVPDEARRIWLVWSKGDNTFELARAVAETKVGLRRGQWTALWRSTQMPFCRRKAEILVAIDLRLGWAEANAHICARLPRAWLTLYYLARLPRANLESLVEIGVVHPRLTLAQARDLVEGIANRCPLGAVKPPSVLRRLQKLKDFVDSTLQQWSPEQLALAESELEAIILKVGTQRSHRLVPLPTGTHPRNQPVNGSASDSIQPPPAIGIAFPQPMLAQRAFPTVSQP
jgi:hypothetical protein